jgi:hypothetical protein
VNTDFGETTTAVEERAPAVRRVNRRLDALIPDKVTLFGLEINGHLPEKMAVKGLQLVKVQARREDVVGEVAKRTLRRVLQDDRARRDPAGAGYRSELTPPGGDWFETVPPPVSSPALCLKGTKRKGAPWGALLFSGSLRRRD